MVGSALRGDEQDNMRLRGRHVSEGGHILMCGADEKPRSKARRSCVAVQFPSGDGSYHIQ